MAGTHGREDGELRARRQAQLIRALGWVAGLVALGAALFDLPAVTFVAVFVAIGTVVASFQKPGHKKIAENALLLLVGVAAVVAFWPPLWF